MCNMEIELQLSYTIVLYSVKFFTTNYLIMYGIGFPVTSAFSLMDQRLLKYQKRIHWFLRKFKI